MTAIQTPTSPPQRPPSRRPPVAPDGSRKGVAAYLRNIYDGVRSTLVGMGITIRYFFTKPVTFQYPEERMPVPPRFRGLHYLEQDICIACRVCERACPVDCIEIRFTRHPGNVNEWFEFSLDYNKCIWCELCCYPCPVDCIHMGREYSLVAYDRKDLIVDLLTWRGMRDKDEKAIQHAIDEKKRKAAEAAAKKKAAAAKKEAKPADTEKKDAKAKDAGAQADAAAPPSKDVRSGTHGRKEGVPQSGPAVQPEDQVKKPPKRPERARDEASPDDEGDEGRS